MTKAKTIAEQAKQLHDKGLSHREIAAILGIERREAARYCQQDYEPAAQRPKTISREERMFIRHLAASGSPADAAAQAGAPRHLAQARADQHLAKPEIRDALQAVMEEEGLTDRAIVQAHKRALKATRPLVASVDGKISDLKREPDFQTQLKAAELGYRIRGHLGSDSPNAEQPSSPPIILSLKQKIMIENLTGQKIEPDEVIEVQSSNTGEGST